MMPSCSRRVSDCTQSNTEVPFTYRKTLPSDHLPTTRLERSQVWTRVADDGVILDMTLQEQVCKLGIRDIGSIEAQIFCKEAFKP